MDTSARLMFLQPCLFMYLILVACCGLQPAGRKLMVSTSAGEEGIDVPSCEFVVRYTATQTGKQLCHHGSQLVCRPSVPARQCPVCWGQARPLSAKQAVRGGACGVQDGSASSRVGEPASLAAST